MERKTKDILLELFQDMEDFSAMKKIKYPPIYLLGGSGCIIVGYLDRATTDVDFLDMNYNANIGRILDRFDMLDIYLMTITLDFEERVIKLQRILRTSMFCQKKI